VGLRQFDADVARLLVLLQRLLTLVKGGQQIAQVVVGAGQVVLILTRQLRGSGSETILQ
jgi:hypothetical protein